MTIQTNTLTGAEFDWYATRSGLASNSPLSAHKKEYYGSKGFDTQKPLTQTEREWLQNVGSSTSNNPYELWCAACVAQSVAVGKSVNECKLNFFRTVASGTNP